MQVVRDRYRASRPALIALLLLTGLNLLNNSEKNK